VALRESDPRSWAVLAQVYRARAEWARGSGAQAAGDVERGLAAAARALAVDRELVAAREAERALRAALIPSRPR
jgi:hypothetical protein